MQNRPNKAPEPTTFAVTSRAPSSTSRASHGRGSSLTLGKAKRMSDPRKQRAREIQDAIRQVLWRDWDPIGVCAPMPADEYDSYIAPIYRLLVSKPKKEAVAAELRRLEEGPIGIGPAQKEALLSIAEKLMAIDVRLDP